MKKFMVMLLSLLMVLSLSSCGKKAEEEVTPEAAEGGLAGVVNPWAETTNDDIYILFSWKFGVPEGAENVVFQYAEALNMAEMRYEKDGASWTARISLSEEYEDISGCYYDFGEPEEVLLTDFDGEALSGKGYFGPDGDGNYAVGLWFNEKEGLMFSLSAISSEGEITKFTDSQDIFFPEEISAGRSERG